MTSKDPLGSQAKRKKLDKAQSQLNKCLNEKRRREQENTYIEELAELISASVTDMSSFSVKPDKCAILQETVSQIRSIKQEAAEQTEAVQQAQVSSSRPAVLANDVLGPLLLEAIDGFLFVVNGQGKIEFVSDNVTQYLKYAQEDLVGKSIYNIIHVGDHAQFSSSLLPMSVHVGGKGVVWPLENAGKGRTFNCRMLLKPAGEELDEVEVKQTQVSQYENMQISTILQPYPSDQTAENSEETETKACLVCIARRLNYSERSSSMLGVEQFTTKQDLTGKIVAFDTSGVTPSHYNYPDFVGQNIQDFCHINDTQQLARHHQLVLKNGLNTSGVYRFKLQENRYVFVQTKSKLFSKNINGESEFVMSTHSIIRECESELELKGSASTSLMKSIIGQGSKPGNTDGSKGQQVRVGMPSASVRLMSGGGLSSAGLNALGGLANLTGLAGSTGIPFSAASDETGLNNLPAGGSTGTSANNVDSLNINDVLDMLPSSTSWDLFSSDSSVVSPSNSTSYTMAGGTTTADTQGPITHVSWSNMQTVNMPLTGPAHRPHGNSTNIPATRPPVPLYFQPLANNNNNNNSNVVNNNNNSSNGGNFLPQPVGSHFRQNSLQLQQLQQQQQQQQQQTRGQRLTGTNLRSPGGGITAAQKNALSLGNLPNLHVNTSSFQQARNQSTSSLTSPATRSSTSSLPRSASMSSDDDLSSFLFDSSVSPSNSVTSSVTLNSSMNSKMSQLNLTAQQQQLQLQQQQLLHLKQQQRQQQQQQQQQQQPFGQMLNMAGQKLLTTAGQKLLTTAGQSTNPLAALQSMEAGVPGGLNLADWEQLSQLQDSNNRFKDGQGLAGNLPDKSADLRITKLRQLLTQKESADSQTAETLEVKTPDTNALSKPWSPTTRSVSPQPGPGPSPQTQEQPVSTSEVDPDSSTQGQGKKGNKENTILKQLLSQEEDEDEDLQNIPLGESPIPSCEQISASSSDKSIDMDKNEAEPKKENVLLKQLLNDEQKAENNGAAGRPNELLHKLLMEDEDHKNAATVESTTNQEVSQSAQDGEGKTSASSGLDNILQRLATPPPVPQSQSLQMQQLQQQQLQVVQQLHMSQQHQVHQQQLSQQQLSQQQLLQQQLPQQQLPQQQVDESLMSKIFSPQGGVSSGGHHLEKVSKAALHDDAHLQSILSNLWDRQTDHIENRKRKASGSDLVDSTDGMSMELSTSSADGLPSKLSQKNVLLTQLLSKKAAKENVVNTQHTVNTVAGALPQAKLPRNLADKIIDMPSSNNNLGNISAETLNAADRLMDVQEVSGIKDGMPTAWDNPRTNPNSPFPGNTKDIMNDANPLGSLSNITAKPVTSGGVFSSMGGGGGAAMSGMEQLSQLLGNSGEMPVGGSTNVGVPMETDSSDQMLSHILQQASELQQEMSSGQLKLDGSMTDDTNLLSQLEQVLSSSDLAEIDSLLGINTGPRGDSGFPSNVSEQMAINAIQQQLMSVDPTTPTSAGPSSASMGGPGLLPSSLQMPHGQPRPQTLAGMNQQGSVPTALCGGPANSSMTGTVNTAGGGATVGASNITASSVGSIQSSNLEQLQRVQQFQQRQLQQKQAQQNQQQAGFQQPPPPPQQQPSPQQQSALMSASQQGPRFSQPQGVGGMNQQNQGTFVRPNQAPLALQVRQSLLMQQRQKHEREKQRQQERLRQQQERQRLLQQQQHQNLQHYGQPSFTQGNMGMDTLPSPGIPENFGELMNTSMAPNVSLQRNQNLPGQLSPRLNQGNLQPLQQNQAAQQQQQHQQQLIRSNAAAQSPQLSPFGQQGQANQWTSRGGQQAAMQTSPVTQTPNNQFGNQLARQFSGNLASPVGQFTEASPFSQQANQMNVFQQQQQQQQQFAQNRMLQRQMSLPVRTSSPRTPQQAGGFGNNAPDPLLISPRGPKMAALSQQSQLSPQFSPQQQGLNSMSLSPSINQQVPQSITSQTGLNAGGFNAGAMTTQVSSAAGLGGMVAAVDAGGGGGGLPTSAAASMHQQGFDQMFSGSMPPDRSQRGLTSMAQNSSTSQFVKQELRAICNARSQTQHSQQPDQMNLDFNTSQLPADILDQITEMQAQAQAQAQGLNLPSSSTGGVVTSSTSSPLLKKDVVLSQNREERRKRMEMFQALASNRTIVAAGERRDDAEERAALLFRNQLINAPQVPTAARLDSNSNSNAKKTGMKMDSVNVVQTEPRAPVEEIKPADTKNSLLQQLLSE